jgi:hypothetical protein
MNRNLFFFIAARCAGRLFVNGRGSILEAFATFPGHDWPRCNSADFYVGCFSPLTCQSFHHASCFSAAALLRLLSITDDNHHPTISPLARIALPLLCLLARLTPHPVPLARLACCCFSSFQLCHACCTALLHACLSSSGSSGQLWL